MFVVSNMCEAHCCKIQRSSTLAQNLDEMEFERGIWSAGKSHFSSFHTFKTIESGSHAGLLPASDGDLPKVRKFLAQGVNPDIRDAAGYTALHYAALKGHIEICDILLQHGADINATTRAGMATALHRAATSGNF